MINNHQSRAIRRLSTIAVLCTLIFPLLVANGQAAERGVFTVGFAQDTMQNDWRAAQVLKLEQALKPYPDIRFVFTDAKGNPARQALDAEQLVSQGVDVLVTSPRDPNIMTPVISKIYRSGTPVVLLTRQIHGDQYTSFISADDREIARAAARYLTSISNGNSRVVMLQGVPTATTAKLRSQGFKQEIAGAPGIQLVAEPVANYLRADAIREIEKIIASGIAFDAIFAHSDSMASGARIALRKAGFDPRKFKIIGIDYIPEAREAIRKGEQSASFTYPTASEAAASTILRLKNGEVVKKHQTIPFVKITRDNVDSIETVFR